MRKKASAIVLIFLFISNIVAAQVPDPQYDDRIKKLEQEITRLQDNIFRTDSTYYTRAYNNGLEGMYVFGKLYADAESFTASANQSALLLKLMNVNNPASLELRKRIIADLQQMIESKVGELSGSDTARKRNLFTVIRNIFSNPLVQTAASFIPIGTQVVQVISSVSSVVAPKLRIEKNALGAVKNVMLDVENMLQGSPLKEIGNKIMPYLNFYDSLFVMNNEFNRQMEYLRNEAFELKKTVYGITPGMNVLTGWKSGQPLNVMIAQFNARYTSPAEIRTKVNDMAEQRIKADSLNETATLVLHEYEHLNRLKGTYESAFFSFRTKYLAVLRKYASQSELLRQYLEPVIAQLAPPEDGNVIASAPLSKPKEGEPVLSSPLIKFDVNLPAATDDQVRRIESFMYKYMERGSSGSEQIKTIIF